MILVSACLLGLNVKYNGGNNINELLLKYCSAGKYIPICPEQLGGLTTPREPAEINGANGTEVLAGRGKVITCSGGDVTECFLRGAEEVIKLTKIIPVKAAVLKERSPSCGVHYIYNGDFCHGLKEGTGVTTAVLTRCGISVYSEEDLTLELLKTLLTTN